MLENGKMGCLRRVFEVIFGHNVINRHFFRGILRHFFSLIRGLRPANLDPRVRLCVTPVDDNKMEEENTSGNDGCLWRLFNCCELFNYPSPADKSATSPARGEVLNNITFKGLDVVRQYAALLERRVQSRKAQAVTRQTKHIRNLLPQCASDATGFLSDVYKKSTRAQKFLADGVQYGRSMIEMLGVLAIIGVLSVGGIAGYSKAMEKWKVNKAMEDYSDIIRGLLEYRENILKNNPDRQTGLTDVMQAAGLVPESWSKISTMGFQDPYGNDVYFYSKGTDEGKLISMDMYLGGETKNSDNVRVSANFSTNLCVELFNNLVYPLHSELRIVVLTSWTGSKSIVFYGDKFCAGKDKCLRSATLIDFKNACDMCDRANTYCNFAIKF